MIENCEREIIELHQFFEAWFNAKLSDNDESFSRMSEVLSPEFIMITPAGRKIERSSLLSNLRSMNGLYLKEDKPSAIWIRNITIEWSTDTYCLANYEEWQGSNDRAKGKGRISSALFEKNDAAPNRVRWIHLHETWIT
ncbi:MAG TPA: hypothetical protein VJ905_00150 [Halalkalibaculum sp.]|nr:hypothetical protein [Halalkalibaculum sp.]